jgi:hypothetical protein
MPRTVIRAINSTTRLAPTAILVAVEKTLEPSMAMFILPKRIEAVAAAAPTTRPKTKDFRSIGSIPRINFNLKGYI